MRLFTERSVCYRRIPRLRHGDRWQDVYLSWLGRRLVLEFMP